MPRLLEVENLKIRFPITKGVFFSRKVGEIRAVDGVSFHIDEGETLGLVGESDCGKSTTARGILRLNKPFAGTVRFDGRDLMQASPAELRDLRQHAQMIFQDPYASLNPRMTIGDIVAEPLHNYQVGTGAERKRRVAALLDRVGLDPRFIRRYPHEFSGGQRQRIGIARALALQPRLILCDEPVSALDVSIQAQIINLLVELQKEMGLSYLFIAHDLAVVRHISHRVAIMYLGEIVEIASYEDIYQNPLHPYTRALLSAIPLPDPRVERKRERIILQGDVPSPSQRFEGCKFVGRCPLVEPRCHREQPRLQEIASGHQVSCHVVQRGEAATGNTAA